MKNVELRDVYTQNGSDLRMRKTTRFVIINFWMSVMKEMLPVVKKLIRNV
jgi:hypothetical protein